MKRHIYKLPNGDFQLGDYPNRRDPDGLNWVWVITHHCVMGCPYCIGWKSKTSVPTLIDKMGGISKVVDGFKKVRDKYHKNIYITISGGEPTLVKQIGPLIVALNKENIQVELHTNLTNSRFASSIDKVDPDMLGQVTATYHGWRLDKDKKAQDLYMKNFSYGWRRGYTMILKTVVCPWEVGGYEDKIKRLKKMIPAGSPVLTWPFIRGKPGSIKDHRGAYPQAYTVKHRRVLRKINKYRAEEQRMYANGAGFFHGMQCDAGNSFLFMDIDGNVSRCYGLRGRRLGNLKEGNIRLTNGPTPCPAKYCGTPFWGLWYGFNPWDYVPASNKEVAYYSRFGPKFEIGEGC